MAVRVPMPIAFALILGTGLLLCVPQMREQAHAEPERAADQASPKGS